MNHASQMPVVSPRVAQLGKRAGLLGLAGLGAYAGYKGVTGALDYAGDALEYNKSLNRAKEMQQLGAYQDELNHERLLEILSEERERQMMFAALQAGVQGQQRQAAYNSSMMNAYR